MRNVQLYYSPDDNGYYYQRLMDFKVSKKLYKTEDEALRDYINTDNPEYIWE